MNPVPFHDDPVKDKKARIRAANAKLRIAYWVPEMAAVHEIRAETLEECWPLLANGFTVMAWDMGSGTERLRRVVAQTRHDQSLCGVQAVPAGHGSASATERLSC